MNIYVYNSSTINEYSVDDCGLISSSTTEVFDCGKIDDFSDGIENCYFITCSETLVPFGAIRIKSTETVKYGKISIERRRFEKLNEKSIILNGLIITWYGYGTVFEFKNGLERQVIPDVSGGGTLR